MESLSQTPDQDLSASAYWSKKFGISHEELEKAIKAGESFTQAIEKYVRNLKPDLVVA